MSFDDAPRRALGVCYYPEHWPEEIWRADAAQMAQSGLTWVRIGEFAWSRLEPAPGALDWGWLDRAIGILGAAGLKVVLGTPTATPPRWMLDRWPDMLALDEIGNPRKFGSRRHYCFSHEGYRGECARITRLLAERYGANPHVHAWQTDNEYGCHDTTVSYSASALTGFRRWLARKYRSPEALNAAWGNVFWSMEYREFAEIDLPNMTVSEPNPSHVLDFRRYSSEQVAEFNRVQTGILRECSDAPILHNFMARTVDFDHYRVADDLDIAAWDSYPLGNLERHSDLGEGWKLRFLRQGDPDFQAFHHDLYRAVGRGRWWVAEQQPGPVNWARFNPAPLPGMTRLWVWEAFAHGAEAVCYFRWRQVPFAQEQMHAGLLRPDNLAAPALAEAGTVASELAQLPDAETAPAPVALVFDYESAWGWKTQPQGGDFDYFRLVFDFYRAMRRLGLSIDVLRPESGELGGYRLIAMPGLMTVGAALSGALGSFSGTVLAGPRSGAKTPSMQIPPGLPPDIPGFDCTVELVESLPPGAAVPLERGGSFVRWFEKLSEHEEVRERTAKGEPALVGSATRLYLAGWPDDAALARILKALCDTADIETTSLPDTVRLRDTPSHRFLFNYGAEPAEACGTHLKPAAVHWLSRSP
ncbi:MAG: beta-galactosidase [Paracoccaceae bacterium]